jgi:hypothetical protein
LRLIIIPRKSTLRLVKIDQITFALA